MAKRWLIDSKESFWKKGKVWLEWDVPKSKLLSGFTNEMTVLMFLFLLHIYFRQGLKCMSKSTDTSLYQFCQVVCHSVEQKMLDKADSGILMYCNQ